LIAACAELVDTLLSHAPSIEILGTSREAFAISGEMIRHVPSLSLPDPTRAIGVEQLSQYEAVQLFIERAILIQPHFTITKENAPAVAQICYRLDGIPLAIELAAARVRGLSVEQIAARLDDRFRLLTGGSRTALPRQRTLQAAIDWSYKLLDEEESRLLRRLSVFAGGWTLEAAEQVCAGDELESDQILDLLLHLVDKSLVVAKTGEIPPRYSMLETIRQYAKERLDDSGEANSVRDRHLEYFCSLAEQARPLSGMRSNWSGWTALRPSSIMCASR
jgi:non-specific serine/threonine protein kinase